MINVKLMSVFTVPLLLLVGCAGEPFDVSTTSKIKSERACAEKNGKWAAYASLYPARELGEGYADDFVCILPTGEGDQACSDSSECETACLAPEDALSGKPAIGHCSAWSRWIEGALVVNSGHVSYQDPNLMTRVQKAQLRVDFPERKAMLLDEFQKARDTWNGHEIDTYSFTVSQQCFCLRGQYLGPNRISVWDGRITRVAYQGPVRDGLSKGDLLTRRSALKTSVTELFNTIAERLQYLEADQVLAVSYDSQYGFPAFFYWNNEERISHDSSTMVLSNFSMN